MRRVRFSYAPPEFCRVAELVQRSIVNREDVGSSPTPTASFVAAKRSAATNAGELRWSGEWSNMPPELSSILSPGTNFRERSLAGKAPSF